MQDRKTYLYVTSFKSNAVENKGNYALQINSSSVCNYALVFNKIYFAFASLSLNLLSTHKTYDPGKTPSLLFFWKNSDFNFSIFLSEKETSRKIGLPILDFSWLMTSSAAKSSKELGVALPRPKIWIWNFHFSTLIQTYICYLSLCSLSFSLLVRIGNKVFQLFFVDLAAKKRRRSNVLQKWFLIKSKKH